MKKVIVAVFLILLFFFGCKKTVNTSPKRLKKGTPEYIMNMGLFYLNQGKIDLAEKKLLKALKQKPDLLQGLNGLGVVYIFKRDFKKAIEYFNKVLRINPNFHDANNSLGLVYTELGNYNLAKENLLIAANSTKYSNPENAFNNLAKLEFEQKKYKSAMRYVNRGLNISKHFAPLLNMKGLIYERQHLYSEALKCFKKARSVLTKDDVNYLINIGRIYTKMGKKNEALDVLEKALSTTISKDEKTLIRRMIKKID